MYYEIVVFWASMFITHRHPYLTLHADNPLVCGCDLVWLVLNPDLMAIFHAQTMCSGGGYMVDLPIDWFHEHCS